MKTSQVVKFNQLQKTYSDKFYNQRTGKLRKTGYVAFNENCSYLARTKKEAIDTYLRFKNN